MLKIQLMIVWTIVTNVSKGHTGLTNAYVVM